jgi:hypothetical protein
MQYAVLQKYNAIYHTRRTVYEKRKRKDSYKEKK